MKHFISSVQAMVRAGDEFIRLHGPHNFHTFAHELMAKNQLPEHFDFKELVEASFLSEFNHAQNYASAQFSDFPITVARGESCFLDLYFWRRRPTVIHDHHFTGAFQCLRGVNVDLEFEFTKSKRLGEFHDLGELTIKQQRKLTSGDIAPIDLLGKFIHQNTHQDELTINACFRTPDIGSTNLSNYLYSGLRFEKHPGLLNRTHRLMNFLFLGDFDHKKLQLNTDDALNFLIRYADSTSQSKSYLSLRDFLDQKVKDELGLDVTQLLKDHHLRMDELENQYD